MFWDNVACVYDVFANVINRKTNEELCSVVKNLILPEYEVLEFATDFSEKMLERAKKNCRKYANVHFEKADIMHLDYPDHSFDAVVAANVIHLLDEPYKALHELERVCRPGGKIIIPTYMNRTENGKINGASKAIEKAGADFKRKFTPETYRDFFAAAGYAEASYTLCEGRIPCAVAVLIKKGALL